MALNKTDDTECIINVTGQQWWWEFDYPSQDGCGGIAEPIVTTGQMVIPDRHPGAGARHQPRRHPLVLDPAAERQAGHGARPRAHLRIQADEPGIYAGQCTEFCGLSHANMRMEVVALDPPRTSRRGRRQPARAVRRRPRRARWPPRARRRSSPSARAATRSTGSSDDERRARHRPARPVRVLRRAPNLTHLMTPQHVRRRHVAICSPRSAATTCGTPTPDEFGEQVPRRASPRSASTRSTCASGCATRRPRSRCTPTRASSQTTDGSYRGMPNLALTEDQIDQLVAYLLERK